MSISLDNGLASSLTVFATVRRQLDSDDDGCVTYSDFERMMLFNTDTQ